MLNELKAELEKYLAGNEADYFYKEVHTEKYGDVDENFENRSRICHGLMFNVCTIDETVREKMIRDLLEQEIISRENDPFQGVGDSLAILTLLMRKYRRPEDEEIFKRAQNANFDCVCGYDPDIGCSSKYYDNYRDHAADPEKYSLERLIVLAVDLHMKKYVCMLVDLFGQTCTSVNDYKKLLWYSQYTGRETDREMAVTKFFESVRTSSEADETQRISAYEEMIGLLTEKGEADRAYAVLQEGNEALRLLNRRAFYDSVFRIMEISPDRVREIWEYTEKFVRKDIAEDELVPVCYSVVKRCAELAGDHKMIRKIVWLEEEKE